MARAEVRTWLSLDEWAKIIGENPFYFNQLDHPSLFPNTRCDAPWLQFPWQNSDQVSRSDVAQAIREAELKISGEVGYNLLPDWIIDERKVTKRPADPTLYGVRALNVRGQRKSVEANKGWVISGGQKATSVIEAAAAVVRSDEDGDGFDELMTVSVATTVTDANEIRVFYAGESGAWQWEVRPIKVTISGGVATITFKSWQLVDPDAQLAADANAIDASDDAVFLTTVDVYRVYNDPQSQVQFLWQPMDYGICDCGTDDCEHSSFSAQDGFVMVRDPRLGILMYAAGNWDADNSKFTSTPYSLAREPEQLRLWYYSGWRDMSKDRPEVEMDDYWKSAVAYYAASLLDRETCGCSNVSELIKYWRHDRTLNTAEESMQNSLSQIDNNFGTTEGAMYAFRRTREPDRRIGR